MSKKAIIVTSGGMDSITNGLMMLEKNYEIVYLHFNYGHKGELGEHFACKRITKELLYEDYPVDYKEIDLPFIKDMSGGSSLVDNEVEVVPGIKSIEMSSSDIGNLWVPGRNLVMISIAAAFAETIGAKIITLGANQSESGYGDNTKDFLDTMTKAIKYGTLGDDIKVISPEWTLDKPHILKWSFDNGYGWIYKYTYSCDAEPVPEGPIDGRESFVSCGECGCCMNRRFSFYVAEKLWGIIDNQHYGNESYFQNVFLGDLKERCKEDWWQYKYLKLIGGDK